ncbi:MAG: MATE family efflux transporter [Gemmiger sp.]
MTKQIDFTTGSLTKQLILFSFPLVLGELLQNLYNSVDALVVGNFVGDTALAAISVCSTLSSLLVSFFNGMSIGAIVIVSRVFGGKQQDLLRRYIQVTFTFSALLGVTLSILGICSTEFFIQLSDAPPDVYQEAVTYLRIYLAGLMFTVIYNVSAGILRAVGDYRAPFLILFLTCCVNIVLDLVFVAGFRLGVAGVSFATVISQFVSVVAVYLRLCRLSRARCFSLGQTVRYGRDIVPELLNIGMPSGLQGSLVSFSNLFIWRYVNQFGSAATAGIGVAQRLDKFIAMPCKAFGTTATTCVSQNIGAKNYERGRAGVRRCLLLSVSVVTVLEIVVLVFSRQCVALFNSSPEIVEIGAAMMRTILPMYIFFALREILYGVLRGHGYTQITTVLSLVGMVGIRQLFLAVSMSIRPAITNIYWCYPIAWGSTMLLIFLYYLIVRRRPDWEDPGETPETKGQKEATA